MKTYLAASGLTVILVLLFLLLSSPVSNLESQALDVKFVLRGEQALDSNVVVIYLDDRDISALGGWPIRRNYYALLINALDDLGAKAIGFDILFEEQNKLYPEFDSLLVAVAAKHGNVVFPSYFQNLTTETPQSPTVEALAEGFEYDATDLQCFHSGVGLYLPYPAVLRSARSVGHTNLPKEARVGSIPMYLRYGQKLFPSLSFEVARVFFGTERRGVSVRKGEVSFVANSAVHRIPLSPDGSFTLNYRGGSSSLNKYRLVEFLQAYDAYRAGSIPPLPVTSVKGKIILVGVIAPGYGKFVGSPYTESFPGVGVHATALDNLITERFLTVSSPLVRHLFSALFTCAAIILILRLKELTGLAITGGFVVLYLTLSLFIFILFAVSLPVVQPLLMVAIGVVSALTLKHRRVRLELTVSESEKDLVEQRLMEKESRLVQLEGELRRARLAPHQQSEAALQREIKKYRDDIRHLSAEAGDFSEFSPPVEESGGEREEFEGLVYVRSGKMGEVVELVKKIAPSDANVFILGESGTGKELIARAIHSKSKRTDKPFIAVNCGALTESLLESELFGHERGAFTGAVKEKAGRFELAEGGTIFLDEITETSESFQVKLLRVLQSGEFERVGGTHTLRVDVRVVAATNRNAKEEIKQKRFREDLFYRLSVFTSELPPLRERKADIPFLVEHFLEREGNTLKLSSAVMDAFLNYEWKGNVRELESVITRAAILARAESRNLIRIKDVPDEIGECLKKPVDLEDQILILLREKGFSRSAISETAEDLGGFNRGTVAEYFRGLAFKTFFEQEFDLTRTATVLASTGEENIVDRVAKKTREYLANVIESVDVSKTPEELKPTLGPKYKNLPQRYHFFLDQLIESYSRGQWRLPDEERRT